MKKFLKLFLFVLMVLPCSIALTACFGNDDSDDGDNSNQSGSEKYSVQQVNDKIANLNGSYDYKDITISFSDIKGFSNQYESGQWIDESNSFDIVYRLGTSNNNKCINYTLTGVAYFTYIGHIDAVICIEGEDYYYAETDMGPLNATIYNKLGAMSASDMAFVKNTAVTKNRIDNSNFYNIVFDKNFNTSNNETMEALFASNVFEIYEDTFDSNSIDGVRHYWDKEKTDRIGFSLSTMVLGTTCYNYVCKIGDEYINYQQYVVENDPSILPSVNSIPNILDNKYIVKSTYQKIDKSYYDYSIGQLSTTALLSYFIVSTNNEKVLWLDSNIFAENTYDKALITSLYGENEYTYSFNAEDANINNLNVIEIQCTKTKLLKSFEFGKIRTYKDNVTNRVSNVLVKEEITAYLSDMGLSVNYTWKVDNSFFPENEKISVQGNTVVCSFNYSINTVSNYTFTAPTTLGDAIQTNFPTTNYSFSNTVQNIDSIVKNCNETLNFSDVPEQTKLPEGVTLEGWYYDINFKYPALLPTQSLKTTGNLSNVILYAKYNNLPTVTLDADGGTLDYACKTMKNYIDNTLLLSNYRIITPVKDGYKFVGWYLSTDAEKDIEALNSLIKTENVVLKAKWEKTYIIKLDTQCLFNAGGYIVTNGTKITNLPSYVDNPGKIFEGWYLDEECTVPVVNYEYTCTGTNKTLYAKYSDGIKLDIYKKYSLDQNYTSAYVVTIPKTLPDDLDFGEFYNNLVKNYAGDDAPQGKEFSAIYLNESLTQPFVKYPTENISLYCGYQDFNQELTLDLIFGNNKSNKDYDNLAHYLLDGRYTTLANFGVTFSVDASKLFNTNPVGISKDFITIGQNYGDDIVINSYYYSVENGDGSSTTYKLTIKGFYFDKQYNPAEGIYVFSQEWTDANSFNWKTKNTDNADLPLWFAQDGKKIASLRIYVDYTIEECIE